jgi:hypothetical protein
MLPPYSPAGHSSGLCGFPYFQHSPLYAECHAYTPIGAEEYGFFESANTGYGYQPEAEASSKQVPDKQLKATPGASLPMTPGHDVRFSVQTNDKTKQKIVPSRSALAATEPPKAGKVCRRQSWCIRRKQAALYANSTRAASGPLIISAINRCY